MPVSQRNLVRMDVGVPELILSPSGGVSGTDADMVIGMQCEDCWGNSSRKEGRSSNSQAACQLLMASR